MEIVRRWWSGVCVGGCLVTLVASACAPGSEAPGRSGGPATSSAQQDDTADGDGTSTPATPAELAGMCDAKVEPARLPPRVMLLLDRSGSMHNCTESGHDGDNNCPNPTAERPYGLQRWEVARHQLVSFLQGDLGSQFHWGLTVFPNTDSEWGLESCAPTPGPMYPIGENGSIPSIVEWLNSRGRTNGAQDKVYGRNGPTNIGHALAGTQLSENIRVGTAQVTRNVDAILLVTDGNESFTCVEGGGAKAKAASLWNDGKGVPVYVLGGFMPDVTKLDAIAAAGGTTKAQSASTAEGLGAALKQIGGEIAPCKYSLDRDDTNVTVVLNNGSTKSVVKTGWKASNRILELDSTLCNPQSATTQSVEVYYNCKTVI